jgi:hypothetical protein
MLAAFFISGDAFADVPILWPIMPTEGNRFSAALTIILRGYDRVEL